MASRRSPNNSITPGGRDLTNLITPIARPSTLHRLEPIRSLQDRRQYHPLKEFRPAAAAQTNSRKIVVKKHLAPKFSSHLSFNVPKDVAICARRKIRKQVLHALRKTAKGGRGRRNWHSLISCKR